MPFDRMIAPGRRRWLVAGVGVPVLLVAAFLVGLTLTPTAEPTNPQGAVATASAAAPADADVDQTPDEPVPSAAPAPANLPTVTYDPAPGGFPADPATMDTVALTEGLHPTRRIAAYNAPGGKPLAFLAPTISGVEVTMPIAERRTGWTAVLLPSANRRLAWVPAGGYETVELRDQIVVERRLHRLTWYREGAAVRTWPVSLGQRGQETPLGRTFILGRTPPPQDVYGGVDIFALGSVPDDPDSVPTGLRGAHIGLHTWYHDRELGKSTTNGCIRLTPSGQRELLAEVRPGSSVVVVEELPEPPPTA